MPINDNISDFIRQYRKEHNLSIAEMAKELGIAKNSVVGFLNGSCNPRADTIELLAEKCGVSPAEIISAQPPGWDQAEIVIRAAKLLGGLSPERRDRVTGLLFSLTDEFSDKDNL